MTQNGTGNEPKMEPNWTQNGPNKEPELVSEKPQNPLFPLCFCSKGGPEGPQKWLQIGPKTSPNLGPKWDPN